MKLASFSVQNYRSITKAYKIPLEDMTVLIGPNNEGKSNVVRALVTALQILEALARMPVPYRDRIVGVTRYTDYDWDRDFPVKLQAGKPNGESVFSLEFDLSDAELKEFRTEVKSKLTGTLPIQIALGPDRAASFKVVKKGPGGPALSKKPGLIGRFIARRLDLEYIPAVRTAGRAQQVVDDLVARALAQAEGDPAYRNALDAIAQIQAPLLAKISTTIKETLSVFLPDVDDVSVQIPQEQRSRALRSCQIIVDDGAPTLLQNKGDGMQSLAALSLMRHASKLGAGERELVLAIEEPESHLHPRAIHQLKAVLKEISEQHQIIMTTHCPLFVDRVNIKSNVIVSGHRAASAKSIGQVREVLGVRVADNLQHAELVLLVEGEQDRVAMHALLASTSKQLGEALDDGVLAIDTLAGGTNLSYKLGQLRDALCSSYVFVDHDDAGRSGVSKAQSDGLCTSADVTFATCPGMDDAELEDLYDVEVYRAVLKNAYGVSLDHPKFKSRHKWSMRMREIFRGQGKLWDKRVESQVKFRVAEAVAQNAKSSLSAPRRGAFDALTTALIERLAQGAASG